MRKIDKIIIHCSATPKHKDLVLRRLEIGTLKEMGGTT
mgnify:CR=1 FL=1